jgi:hypothetical protein
VHDEEQDQRGGAEPEGRRGQRRQHDDDQRQQQRERLGQAGPGEARVVDLLRGQVLLSVLALLALKNH